MKFWIQDDILYSIYKKPIYYLTLNQAKKDMELRCQISNYEPQYWCMNLRNLRYVSREVNTYMNENGQEFIHACAVIGNSHLVKFMFNVFISIKKPKIPIAMFTSEREALVWLKGIQRNHLENETIINI